MTMSYRHPFAQLKKAMTRPQRGAGVAEEAPVFLCFSDKGITPLDAVPHPSCKEATSGAFNVAIYPHATEAQVHQLGQAWHLQPRLVSRLLKPAGGRPGQFGDVLYLPLRGAEYIDETGDVQLIPLQVLMRGEEMVILLPDGVWLDGSPLFDDTDPSVENLEFRGAHTDILEDAIKQGPPGLAYWLVEEVVSTFVPALEGLEEDQEQIEVEIFKGKGRQSEKIYKLNQEAAELLRATNGVARSIPQLAEALSESYPHSSNESHLDFEDLEHRVQTLSSQVSALREALSQVLTINATLVAERQNDDMKKISGWAGIAFAPTLVAGIYGMNFVSMPELDWGHGYPVALAFMAFLSGILYIVFKKNDWI